MGLLEGRTIIVTGAAQGMGAMHARRCVEEGANVVITDVQAEAGAKHAASLGESACFVEHDVTSEEHWDQVAETALARTGRIDGLVNNAAVHGIARLLEESPDSFRRMFEVNVIGTFLGIRRIAPVMHEGGGGSIVNISSAAGMQGHALHAAYGASKWAVRGLSKVAALELGHSKVRVNTVHPGAIEGTGMFFLGEEHYERLFGQQPLPRPGLREEVSGVVLFLLSDASSYVTGHEHVVDGGMIIA